MHYPDEPASRLAPPDPAVAAEATPPQAGAMASEVPVKVLVVDDELVGFTAAHLREFADRFVAELSDITSPTAAAVWNVVSTLTGRPAFDEVSPKEIEGYFASDEFVQRVVLSKELRAALPCPETLQGFYDHEKAVRDLRALLEAAYAAPDFELTFQADRPSAPAALMAYDLVVLDLVLANSAAPVDELVGYLGALAKNNEKLPCLIVLSSREEMITNRPRFSADSHISAAGLLLLEKKHVCQTQFGVIGLQLGYEQLARQREVAQSIRMFVRAWMDALDGAQKAVRETLWNLDAAAMQEIHLSANCDDDPYDAHLNELVAREYLWHVEGAAPVIRSIDSLNASFQSGLKNQDGKLVIAERFIAPYADPKPGRALASHYNWTGFTPTGRLDEHSAADLASQFNRLVPFGAVLAPETLTDGAECWVHITQQCDLNGAVRVGNCGDIPSGNVSAMFAVTTAECVSDQHLPNHTTHELVAHGLHIANNEYDLKLVNGHLISLPIKQLIDCARRSKLRVVGRLRHDIATQFLNATANHMTRPAQLKVTRVEVHPAYVFLWGKGFNGDQPLPFVAPDGSPTLQVSVKNKLYYFSGQEGMWVALWLTDLVRTKLGKGDLAPMTVSNTVRGGMRKDGNVVSVIKLRVVQRAFGEIDRVWKSKLPDDLTLYLIYEPDTPTG